MSAWVVSKAHIDLMVKAAEHYGRLAYQGSAFRWWKTTDEGEYAGWYELGHTPRSESDHLEVIDHSMAGQLLVNENVMIVHDRYPGDDVDAGELPGPTDAYYLGPYVFEDPLYVLTPAEVFKAIDCFDYQSCEHEGWRNSTAFQFCEALRLRVCSSVPGYEDAPWGWDEVPRVAA